MAYSAELHEMELASGGLAVPDTSVIQATKGSGLFCPLGSNQKRDCVNCAIPEMYCGTEQRAEIQGQGQGQGRGVRYYKWSEVL